MTKITQQALEATRISCFDYMYKSNNALLRERYAFLITEAIAGIYLVECNTEGCFFLKGNAGLQEAFQFISST